MTRPANPNRGEARLELTDGTHILRFDFNACALFEEEMSKRGSPTTIYGIIGRFRHAAERSSVENLQQFQVSELRVLVWAGLLHENPDLTIYQAGQLMERAPHTDQLNKFAHVMRACLEAISSGMQLPEELRDEDTNRSDPPSAQSHAIPSDGAQSRPRPTASSA